MKKCKIYLLTLLFFVVQLAYSQEDDSSDFDALKIAYLNVKQEKYLEAYPYYEKMLSIYPKDPTYNYYAGVCLLFIEESPISALSHLRFASTKDVSIDVWFYLGLAYLQNYQFEKALDNFERFEKRASKAQLKKTKVQNYISMAQNGLYLVRYIKEPIVYEKKRVAINDFYKTYEIYDLEGQFIDRFGFFNQKTDSVVKESVMFVPRFVKGQDALYYSAKNKKREDYDIFRITKLNDSLWREPENIGDVINTPFDESYPYMHIDGSTLYFASKGHYSMGGYDLYKSTWDWETQKWTEPENLDFPINSPYNDILFVPSPNKKYALFASGRGAKDSECFVYKIKLNNSKPYIKIQSHDEILDYAELDVNITPGKVKNDRADRDKFEAENVDIIKINTDEGFLNKNEYDSLINLAVNYQLKADSLRWLMDDKRMLFNKTKAGADRVVLGNAIIELEREAYLLQKNADRCYERVREIEQKNLANANSTYHKTEIIFKDELEKTKEKQQKLYVEPVEDILVKSRLELLDTLIKGNNVNDNEKYGLWVKQPSIYNNNNPIPVNGILPNGIIYMIQLGAFSSEKKPIVFKGLTPLSCIKKENSKIRKYYCGRFLTLQNAEKDLPVARNAGLKDAYIVAFHNGNIIPVKNAVKLESKSIKPIGDKSKNKIIEENINQESLEIIYVLKSKAAIKDTLIIKKIKDILPDDANIYIENKQKQNSLLIKSFSNYEKANEVKARIGTITNNVFEIHAYFAENHIPLDHARKISK